MHKWVIATLYAKIKLRCKKLQSIENHGQCYMKFTAITYSSNYKAYTLHESMHKGVIAALYAKI